jgi:hypothetical protein
MTKRKLAANAHVESGNVLLTENGSPFLLLSPVETLQLPIQLLNAYREIAIDGEAAVLAAETQSSCGPCISHNPLHFLNVSRIVSLIPPTMLLPAPFVGCALTLKLLVAGEFADTFLHRTSSFVAGAFDTVFVHHIRSPSKLHKPIITDLVQVPGLNVGSK